MTCLRKLGEDIAETLEVIPGIPYRATFSSTRSNVSGSPSSAPIWRAVSMNRLNCSGLSGGGGRLRGIRHTIPLMPPCGIYSLTLSSKT